MTRARALLLAYAFALAACAPPPSPRPPLALEPVRSAEAQANLSRALTHDERSAALAATVEHMLGIERRERGLDATLNVIVEGVAEADVPQAVVGVAYATRDALRAEAARTGPAFYLALGAPTPGAERDAILVPIERRAVPTDAAAEEGLIAAGECMVRAANGAPAFIEFCHYDSGHGGD